jgi:hypothetical protein
MINISVENLGRLDVKDWCRESWTKSSTQLLAQECLQSGTNCLYVVPNVMPPAYSAFDYKSTSLVVDFRGSQLPKHFAPLFASLRIKTIVFILSDIEGIWRTYKLTGITKHVWDERWLINNYHTTEIKYVTKEGHSVDLFALARDDNLRKIETLIDRNKMNRRRCKQAASAFLSPGFKRLKRFDPNLCKLIARMIWQTRGTKVWSPLE